MIRSSRWTFHLLWALAGACLAVAPSAASAQIGEVSWTDQTPKFKVLWPYNVGQSARYSLSNGVYHLWVFNNDVPFESSNTTKPRTEQPQCMLFWFDKDGGSLYEHSNQKLLENMAGKWFQVNVDHKVTTHTITLYINQQQVWTGRDNGPGDFYMKDGVDMQKGGSQKMEVNVRNISLWTKP